MTATNYDKALNQALQNAFDSLKEKDLKEAAFKSGATYEGDGLLKLDYLNTILSIQPMQEQIMMNSDPASARTSILSLHYLLRASGAPLAGRMIGFKEVPQGELYFQPFRNRVIFSALGILEKSPEDFTQAAEKLQGESVQGGDLSYRFRVFPYAMVQYIWFKGEEGIPPDLNILFDASIPEYLSTEDIVVMCEEVNRNLKAVL
jgi:hypothetical protein